MKASDTSSTTRAANARARRSASQRTPDRFALAGRSIKLDPRTNAVRKDIADVELAGRLFAPHYARAMLCGVRAPHAALRIAGAPEARAESQLVHGETFAVLEISGGYAWGYCGHDHHVGYVDADALGDPIEATHVVTAREALLFTDADIKAPVLAALPIGARLAGVESGDFLATDEGVVHLRQLSPIDAIAGDAASFAERLDGAPYRWGGRGGDGVDCSGLVQMALGLTGVSVPRDSDQQRDSVGEILPEGAALQRGDLVFFAHHVGMMIDGERVIHANSHAMAVAIEPLAAVIERLGEKPLARRIGA